MRSLNIIDACRNIQIHIAKSERPGLETKCCGAKASSKLVERDERDERDSEFHNSSFVARLADPEIKPFFKPVDYVKTLAEIHKELEVAAQDEKSRLYMEQSFVFRGLGEMKLVRRSLRLARHHTSTVHEKLVYSAWLKYERRDEELGDSSTYARLTSAAAATAATAKTATMADHIPSLGFDASSTGADLDDEKPSKENDGWHYSDLVFHIDGEKISCNRQKMAALSLPFNAMLNGCFTESRRTHIEFSKNGISATAMRVVDKFSRAGSLGRPSPSVVIEVMCFANKFFCDKLKEACDQRLARLVHTLQEATTFIDCALDENARALISTCLQVMLKELPQSMHNPRVNALLCTEEGKKKLAAAGHSSFALYCFLSQVAREEDKSSATTLKLVRFMNDCATSSKQKALALHQLGCGLLFRKQYMEALQSFEAAAEEGHIYSMVGVARVKYKQGLKLAAHSDMSNVIACYKNNGWMYEERSLYSADDEKLSDLNMATELDPTLTYPYKYRAALLMDEKKAHEAIAEINRIIGCRVSPECLELRIYFNLAVLDHEAAVRDLRALLTFEPSYMLYNGRVLATHLLDLLRQHVVQLTKADFWMQLYDYWSAVDDISSLAVVHRMLESEDSKGVLYFRQSLLLLRLSCPKVALRSLRQARDHASSEQERLVYEGWLLYDTGHRQEALSKAEESIAIQRSFEAFFLKAYALADSSLDPSSSTRVIGLLEEALKCPSDGLRKGQALNNLGSVYVDCGNLSIASDCYVNALKIRHTRAHQGLARVYFLQGDRKYAYEEMTKLIEKARNNASAYEKRAEYCDRDLILADLSMVTQLDPLRTYPYRYRAAVAMDNQRDREAIAELSRAIAFKPDLQLLHLRAAFHECSGEISEALRDCRAALSIDPNHLDTIDLYSRVQNR